jgi:two-component system response regulator CitB
MRHEQIDVLIVEDENELAQLHAELIGKHPRLRLVGIATSLAEAKAQLASKQPQLVLLDNYLPDGKGITLIITDDHSRQLFGYFHYRRQRHGYL